MICPRCGNAVLENFQFCAYCGAPVDAQISLPDDLQPPVKAEFSCPQSSTDSVVVDAHIDPQILTTPPVEAELSCPSDAPEYLLDNIPAVEVVREAMPVAVDPNAELPAERIPYEMVFTANEYPLRDVFATLNPDESHRQTFTENYHHFSKSTPLPRSGFTKFLLVLLVLVCFLFSIFTAAFATQAILFYDPYLSVFDVIDQYITFDDDSSHSSSKPSSGSSSSSGSSGSSESSDTTDTQVEVDPLPVAPDDAVDEGESVYPNGISIAEYRALTLGMTYAEVSALIGGDGTPQYNSDGTVLSYDMLAWLGEYNTSAYVILTFEDQILVSVQQEGLF